MICGLRSGSLLHTEAVPELWNADPGAEDGSSCVFSMCMFVVRVDLEGFFCLMFSHFLFWMLCAVKLIRIMLKVVSAWLVFFFISPFFPSKHEWIKNDWAKVSMDFRKRLKKTIKNGLPEVLLAIDNYKSAMHVFRNVQTGVGL